MKADLGFTLPINSICISSGLRLFAVLEIFDEDNNYDLIWGGRSLGVWSAIEMNVAIVCCCLPPLRPLLGKISSKLGLKARMTTWWRRASFATSRIKGGFSKTSSSSAPYSEPGKEDVELQVGCVSGGDGVQKHGRSVSSAVSAISLDDYGIDEKNLGVGSRRESRWTRTGYPTMSVTNPFDDLAAIENVVSGNFADWEYVRPGTAL